MNIETSHRRIVSEIPHPDSHALIEELGRIEPRSMGGMPPIVWDRAEGYQVHDPYGNVWIDFSSAVILANAGHANPAIGNAIRAQLDAGLWQSYCNPSAIRLRMTRAVLGIAPAHLDKVFLLTTGAEATECAIKLMRLHGRRTQPEKYHILSFLNAFHGRTMAAQAAGGFPDQQAWMGATPGGFHHIPFPECARCPWGKACYAQCGRECLKRGLDTIREAGPAEDQFAGVLSETFQGPTVAFMPPDYAVALRQWADEHGALLAFDEIQAGFGRTGKWFGCEHYPIEPDLLCLGKGMTSCLPMSAVLGRGEILDLPEHGEMSSTHTGNPLCAAAALANIEQIREHGLVDRAAALGEVLRDVAGRLRQAFPRHVGAINGRGLAWAVYLLDPSTGRLDIDVAQRVTTCCMQQGLFMMQTGRGTLKIAPPLTIPEDALREGLDVIGSAVSECVG